MRLGYAARYVPTYVKVYPHSTTLEEFGGKGSLEKYGAVLVSGENKYTDNKIAMHTTTGKLFMPRIWLPD